MSKHNRDWNCICITYFISLLCKQTLYTDFYKKIILAGNMTAGNMAIYGPVISQSKCLKSRICSPTGNNI